MLPDPSMAGNSRTPAVDEVFYTLKEAQIIIEQWKGHYNTMRPPSALEYRPPAPETIVPVDDNIPMH